MPALTQNAPLSRRGLFSTLAALGAAAGSAATAMAGPPRKIRADIDPSGLLTRLVQRTNYGISETELTRAESLGYSGYLGYQLNYTMISDAVNEANLAAALPNLALSAFETFPQNHTQLANQLTEATILRAAFSTRGLYQRMVEFWTDHFNIDIRQSNMPPLKMVDDRDVIRANALGNFGTLLRASAHSAAMMMYLDNDASTANNPNENYAREIMELHSMGVDGGYTQTDVEQVARCFTGWGRWPFNQAGIGGSFRYNPGNHRTGTKVIFAGTPQQLNIPDRGQANGQQDGEDVINALIAHPSTARYIAKKLARFFLGETVPQQTIDEISAEYTRTNGDIKSMIRVALKPEHLATSPLRYKRPFHAYISALRALPVTITTTATLRQILNEAGHQPFTWGTPDGFPDHTDYWVGGVLARWNYGARLLLLNGLNPGINGISVNVTSYLTGLNNASAIIQKINRTMFGGELTPDEILRLTAYLALAPTNATRQRETIGVAIGSPSFQWY
jgi:uncharacterized protein (DUF1800 family)